LSISLDKKHKIIRRIETDTASTHDGQHFNNVFDTSNTSRDIYVDRSYPSEEREAWLKENGFRNQTQRKGKRNKRIAKTRARVEHVFGAIEQMGGKLLRTIGRAHHFAEGLTENFRLFEVPYRWIRHSRRGGDLNLYAYAGN